MVCRGRTSADSNEKVRPNPAALTAVRAKHALSPKHLAIGHRGIISVKLAVQEHRSQKNREPTGI